MEELREAAVTRKIETLTDLLTQAGAKRFLETPPPEDMGLAEHLPFPFMAIVAQQEMKLALLLALINPNIGGVLLVGPRGTAKTTAVRSLSALLPEVSRSLCPYGCLPEDIISGGMDAVCADCARRYGEGDPLTYMDRVRLIELPLNARLEDVVGGIDERAAVQKRLRLNRGILARADKNILFVDEVNLLDDDLVNAVLDASAQGIYTLHRGTLSATYRARFVLIGSMNPEEGRLRPQILDRFGLRVVVRGLDDPEERLEAYRRSIAHRSNPRQVIADYDDVLMQVREELQSARVTLPNVELTKDAQEFGLNLIDDLGIHSLRAEITLFEAARTHAVADGREKAEPDDVEKVAEMALRLRRSDFIDDYLSAQIDEEKEISRLLSRHSKTGQSKGKNTKRSKQKSKKP
jgi:magnesium chelatase subunit I